MLSSLRVSHRLLLGFGLIITMLVIVTVMGIDEVDTIDKKMTTINDVNSVKQRLTACNGVIRRLTACNGV